MMRRSGPLAVTGGVISAAVVNGRSSASLRSEKTRPVILCGTLAKVLR
jgi:hypothetical protein